MMLLVVISVGVNGVFARAAEKQEAPAMHHQRQDVTPEPEVYTISTSRPSFTDASTTVPPGSLQFENGVTYQNLVGGGGLWTTPETLMRLGISHHTELRLTPPVYTHFENNQGPGASNFSDMSVGLSHHVRLPGKIDMAFIPILNLPTGANAFSSNALDPEFRISASKNITNKLSIYSMQAVRTFTSRQAAADFVYTPTLITYYGLNKALTGFLEYAAFIPNKGTTNQFIQSGLLYVVKQRHQFDIRVAAGLNGNAPHFLVGAGYSFRLDGLFKKKR